MLTAARDYIFKKMPKIKGYLGPVDASAMAAILIGQTKMALRGGVAEIGVFFGRSFFLLATLKDPQERAFAADLFDIGAEGDKDSLQLSSFLATAKRLHIIIDRESLFIGNSQDLEAATLSSKLAGIRFFSIDGAHDLKHVKSDADIAAKTIADFGVICFDDFCSPEWPEVSLAVFEFLRDASEVFVPFMISQKKIFLCKKQYHSMYCEMVESSVLLRRVLAAPINMMGNRVIFVRNSFLARGRDEALARVGLSRFNSLFY